MPRKPLTEKELKAGAKRWKQFRSLFRFFDSINEGAEWCSKIANVKIGTVLVWRCKTSYYIPKKKFDKLMEAKKNNPIFRSV